MNITIIFIYWIMLQLHTTKMKSYSDVSIISLRWYSNPWPKKYFIQNELFNKIALMDNYAFLLRGEGSKQRNYKNHGSLGGNPTW